MYSAKPKDLQKLVFLVWNISLPEIKAATHTPARNACYGAPAYFVPTLHSRQRISWGNFCAFHFSFSYMTLFGKHPFNLQQIVLFAAEQPQLSSASGWCEGPGRVGTFYLANFKERDC